MSLWLRIAALGLMLGCGRTARTWQGVGTQQVTEPTGAPESYVDVLSQVLHGDPFVRRARPLAEETLARFEDARDLARWQQDIAGLESSGTINAVNLSYLQARYRGRIGAVLTAGYRLQQLEDGIATQASGDPTVRLLPWVTPIVPGNGNGADDDAAWPLASAGTPAVNVLRHLGEREVLRSWLLTEAPLTPVAEALESTLYDSVREQRLARLIRAAATTDTTDPTPELQYLMVATRLAVQRAAADRDHEQAAYADARADIRTSMGFERPIRDALAKSFDAALPFAGSAEGRWTAVLSDHLLFYERACEDLPCAVPGRTSHLSQLAGRSPTLDPYIALWKVIAMDRALDGMDLGRKTVRYPWAMMELADVLLGTGAGALNTDLLLHEPDSAEGWSAVSTALDAPHTSWEATREQLGVHLEALVDDALAYPHDDALTQWLKTIRARVQG